TELSMAEIDTGYLVAFRAVAQNAICAKQPPAFLNIGWGVSVLRQQGCRQREQERKWNQSHAYCLSWEIGSYGIAAGLRGQYSVLSRNAVSDVGHPCYSAIPFRATACHYI